MYNLPYNRQVIANGVVIGEERVTRNGYGEQVVERIHNQSHINIPQRLVAKNILEAYGYDTPRIGEKYNWCPRCGIFYTISEASMNFQCICRCGTRLHGNDGQPIKHMWVTTEIW